MDDGAGGGPPRQERTVCVPRGAGRLLQDSARDLSGGREVRHHGDRRAQHAVSASGDANSVAVLGDCEERVRRRAGRETKVEDETKQRRDRFQGFGGERDRSANSRGQPTVHEEARVSRTDELRQDWPHRVLLRVGRCWLWRASQSRRTGGGVSLVPDRRLDRPVFGQRQRDATQRNRSVRTSRGERRPRD